MIVISADQVTPSRMRRRCFFPFDFYLFYSLFLMPLFTISKEVLRDEGLASLTFCLPRRPILLKTRYFFCFWFFYDSGGEAVHQQVAEVRERNAHKAAGGSGRRIVSH